MKNMHEKYATSVNTLLESLREDTALMLQTAEKKNADYAGGATDPFKNFRLVGVLGVCSTEQGIVVRMADKLARISTLLDKEPSVVGESIMDTLLDLANYALILRAWLKESRPKKGVDVTGIVNPQSEPFAVV